MVDELLTLKYGEYRSLVSKIKKLAKKERVPIKVSIKNLPSIARSSARYKIIIEPKEVMEEILQRPEDITESIIKILKNKNIERVIIVGDEGDKIAILVETSEKEILEELERRGSLSFDELLTLEKKKNITILLRKIRIKPKANIGENREFEKLREAFLKARLRAQKRKEVAEQQAAQQPQPAVQPTQPAQSAEPKASIPSASTQ